MHVILLVIVVLEVQLTTASPVLLENIWLLVWEHVILPVLMGNIFQMGVRFASFAM